MTKRFRNITHALGTIAFFLQKVIVFSCFAILTANSTQVKSEEYIIHLSPTGTAPFAMIDRSGDKVRYYGIMYEFLDAFESAHPEITRKTVLLPRKRLNAKMLEGKDIDIQLSSPSFVSTAVMEHYRFTDTFLTSIDKVVTHRDSSQMCESIHDLKGKTIGTIRGYSYPTIDSLIASGEIQDIRVDTHEQAVGMLHKKRIDAYIGNIHVTPVYLEQLDLDVSDFVFCDQALYKFDLAFAVSKNRPELYEKLNKFLNQFVADGSLEVLVKNYTRR